MVVSGQKIYTKHREQHGGEYILEMLSHLPASICYNDWFRVGCFMKYCCRNLFTDVKEVFGEWSSTSDNGDHVSRLERLDQQWDQDWKVEHMKTFETFRYIVKHTSEDGKKFVEETTLDILQQQILDTEAMWLGTSDLARILINYQGHSYLGNPDDKADYKLFELANRSGTSNR